jgi:hypothetical protein
MGETIGQVIENCLLDWGIDKLLTVIVDNASSNSVTISYLKNVMKIGQLIYCQMNICMLNVVHTL